MSELVSTSSAHSRRTETQNSLEPHNVNFPSPSLPAAICTVLQCQEDVDLVHMTLGAAEVVVVVEVLLEVDAMVVEAVGVVDSAVQAGEVEVVEGGTLLHKAELRIGQSRGAYGTQVVKCIINLSTAPTINLPMTRAPPSTTWQKAEFHGL